MLATRLRNAEVDIDRIKQVITAAVRIEKLTDSTAKLNAEVAASAAIGNFFQLDLTAFKE